MTALQQLVDAMLERARWEHPGVEFSIVLNNANSLLLPMDADQLDRARDGVPGFYRGHVYRNALVESTPSGPDLDTTAWLSPVQGTGAESAPLYRVDLDSGEISTVGRNAI